MTYTVALLEVSQSSYDDIKRRIEEINEAVGGNQYADMFMENGAINLNGVALVPEPKMTASVPPHRTIWTANPGRSVVRLFRNGQKVGSIRYSYARSRWELQAPTLGIEAHGMTWERVMQQVRDQLP